MGKILLFIFFLFSFNSSAQGESNIWYFGEFAGLDFNSGSPVALTDSNISNFSAAASICNSNGQLLFYTDGNTVWDKNHQLMLNGTFLLGSTSTSQGRTIVPKPGTSNLYYIFTIDYQGGSNGLRYSVVDMNLNGGLGAVTSEKNVLVYTPTTERFSIVKHANNIDYWIVTHAVGNNTFYSHLLTYDGLSSNPVTSNIGAFEASKNSQGYMKISPDGSKLAIYHNLLSFELFDFDQATGVISNPIVLRTVSDIDVSDMYGVEFSPNSKVLYLTIHETELTQSSVIQYDLISSDIVGSAFTILTPGIRPMALQLGPDGKIYIAQNRKLGVINNPNLLGTACDLNINAVDLAGRRAHNALPPFVSSFFFQSDIEAENLCFGQNTQFSLNSGHIITSAAWDFGDGNTSNDLTPSHNYATTGTYTVSVIAASAADTSTKTREITISPIPTATQPQDLLVCDDNNDGLFSFDLSLQSTAILNGQDPNLYNIKYYANAVDYGNKIAIPSPNNYINKMAYQQETITAEVSNKVNGECKSTTTFTIDVFDMPLPNLPSAIPDLTSCDNSTIGTDVDGKVILDLTQRATAILKGQSAAEFLISYYKDSNLLHPILTPEVYQNANATETIYVKVFHKDNPDCMATTSFKIEVFALPVIATVVDLKQCDEDTDGFSVFNLEESINKIIANAATETVVFFETLLDAQNNSNPILNPINYTNKIASIDQVFVRVSNANGCFRISQLNLVVSTTQIPLTFKKDFRQCDDAVLGTNTDGIAAFDFSEVTNQILNIFPSGQQVDISYYRNLTDALAEKDPILDISNYRNIGYPNTQNIYIRVDDRLNNDCLGLGNYITLTVEPIPIVAPMTINHCDDNQDGIYAFDTSVIQANLLSGLTNVTVSYFDQNNTPLPSPLPNPFTTASQSLKVIVTNITTTVCSFETTLQFIVDDLPEAFPIAASVTSACDDETDPLLQDGKYAFDTSGFQTVILGGQTGVKVAYFDENNNPLPSPLPNPFVTATQDVKVEVVNIINPSCKATTVISFVVHSVPSIQLMGSDLVCSDSPTFTKIINAGLIDETQKGNFTYLWSLDGSLIENETDYELTVNKKGDYQVEVINNQGCSRTRTITVNASDKATVNIEIVDLSSENSIKVLAIGAGNYVFSLDDENGSFQSSNEFVNVPAGIHTVYVKDLNGCGIVSEEVAVLGIPNYFTPNQDGYNDSWNIKGVNADFNVKTKVQIFDRYGKLMKEITPSGNGWDGSYQGILMPSSDYWYVIRLEDGRVFKGHFALKR
ncbi:hypothetical protein GCM10008015_19720 [Flavobacterium palustre]|uniref:PKD domain-containing protein n=1 Tax=Flavobacterium palustre TaxID=1476463 RepID=A0ABQ1HJD2_9FLAO|nr:T9SS type B sorting domain-containing protein [Flavobacterium palustre]GGA79053.1 hypothetical protein GCM10008015_19720 [Flavobacterium palustre]